MLDRNMFNSYKLVIISLYSCYLTVWFRGRYCKEKLDAGHSGVKGLLLRPFYSFVYGMFIATLTLFHPRCYRMCPVCRKPSAFVTPVSILPLDFSDPGILQECQKLSWIAFAISLVLLCFALWLIYKTRVTLSTNQIQKLSQSPLGRLCFPRFRQFGLSSQWLLNAFSLIRMAVVITLDLRHSLEKRSKSRRSNAKQTCVLLCFLFLPAPCVMNLFLWLVGKIVLLVVSRYLIEMRSAVQNFQCFLDIFQSEVWIDDPVEKKKLIEDYKSALRFTE